MIERVKQRIEQLKAQQKQGETMKTTVTQELFMITGALSEATEFLNYLVHKENADKAKIEAEAKAAATAKSQKGKPGRKKRTLTEVPKPAAEQKAA